MCSRSYDGVRTDLLGSAEMLQKWLRYARLRAMDVAGVYEQGFAYSASIGRSIATAAMRAPSGAVIVTRSIARKPWAR